MFAALRILIGVVLLASGIEKSLSPYQNFLYIIQAYQMLPSWAETTVAMVLPWVELCVGLLLVLGLWLTWALRAALVFFAMFITVVGQGLARGLPLDQCGCFGAAIHIAPKTIIVADSATLLLIFLLLRNVPSASLLSLDKIFLKKDS